MRPNGLLTGGTLRIVTGENLPLIQDTSAKVEVNASLHPPLPPPRRPPPTADRPGPGRPGSALFLTVILTAQLMVVLDTTIVNVALPHIQRSLAFTGTGLSWVINAYILTFGGLLLLGARAGDLLGRRLVFLAGIALFSASSLAGGFAVAGWMLLAPRALQGVGAALAAPIGPVAAHHRLPRRRGSGCAPSPSTRRCPPPAAPRVGGRRPSDRARVVALGHVRERAHRAGGLGPGPHRRARDSTAPRPPRHRRRRDLHRRYDRRGATASCKRAAADGGAR